MLQVEKIATLTGHAGAVYTLCKNKNNLQEFFSTGGDGNLVKWNDNDLDKGVISAKVQSQIFSMTFIAKSNTMLLGQMQGGIHVLDLDNHKEIKHLAFHKNGVFDLLTANDESIFFSAGGDGVLSLWSSENYMLLKSKKISEKSIRCIAIDEQNMKIYAGCSDNNIYVLHYKTFEILRQWQAHENSVFSICLSPCGKYILSGSRDAHLAAWSIENNYALHKTQSAHLFTINHIVYHPKGKWLATAGRDKHIKIWDAQSFNLLKVIDKEKYNGHVNSVNHLLWNVENEYLISCSDDRSIMVWRIND